jgi:hypothetical protein
MVPPTTDRKVFGGTYPALIWKDVMEVAHFGLGEEVFATPPPSSTTTTTRPPSMAVETPVLVGLSMDEAQVLLAATGEAPARLPDGSEMPGLPPIRITSVIEIPTNDSVPGVIIGQSPAVGSTILPAGSMVVEVAVQPPPVPVPTVVGLGVDEAGTLLAESVLGYEITEVANPDDPETPPQTVWHQEPVPGTEVPEGSVVILQVTPPAPPEPEPEPEPDPEAEPGPEAEGPPAADTPEGG